MSAKPITLFPATYRHNVADPVAPSSLGWCQTPLDTLQAYVGRTHAKSFIILKDGKIAVEWYFDGFTQDSVHYWASATQNITWITRRCSPNRRTFKYQ